VNQVGQSSALSERRHSLRFGGHVAATPIRSSEQSTALSYV